MRLKTLLAAVSLMALCAAGSGKADTLNIAINADNQWTAYVSSSDTALGTLIGSDTSAMAWNHLDTASGALSGSQNLYLHIVATNYGGPGGVIGNFSITGGNYVFAADSSISEVTNTSTFEAVSQTGSLSWIAPVAAAVHPSTLPNSDLTFYEGVSANYYGAGSEYVWSSNTGYGTTFLSSEIVYTGPGSGIGATPELPTSLMMTFGILGLGFMAWRRQKAEA